MKNKFSLSLLAGFLIISFSNAQGGFESGYVITNSSDTLFGNVKAKYTIGAGQHKIFFQTPGSSEKKKFFAPDIKEFKKGRDVFEVINMNKIVQAGVFASGYYDTSAFAQVLVKGFLSLYEIFERTNTGSGPYGGGGTVTNTYWLLKKRNSSSFYKVKFFGYKKQMLAFFDDCRSLQDKITDRELKRSDMVEIVNFYNEMCGLR